MPSDSTRSGSFTVYDLKPPDEPLKQWRRIPAIAARSLGIVWRAGRNPFLAVTVLQFGAAIAIGLQLLVGRRLLQSLMQDGTGGVDYTALVPDLILLIGATVFVGGVGAFAAHQQRLLSELVSRDTFDRIIDVSSGVELASFEDPRFFDQLSRARTSGMSKPVEVVNGISALVMAIITSASIGAVLFVMHPLLLVAVLVAGIPVFFSTLYNSRQAYEFEYAWTPRSRERVYLLELLTGRRSATEIRVFGATRFLRGRYDLLTLERLSRLRIFLGKRLQVALAGTLGGTLGMALALASLGWLVVTGRVDVATAVAAGVAMQLLSSRIAVMTRGIGNLVEAGMFLNDYHRFLDLGSGLAIEPGTNDEPGAAHPPQRFQELRVENVSFAYPGTSALVLEDVSLTVKAGEIVALVGANGSGKTTLVKLICRLYRPDSGRILWNGRDADELAPSALRSDITVIFQDFLQYHLSVIENIALGRVGESLELGDVEEQVVAAAKRAGADEYLSKLPSGYATRLGRQFYGGHELSVGQWQRLALARAFYRGGGFLIMDEPTAALDPRAEHELFQQMRALSAGRSVLLISHRFSSVRSADRIYVLDNGRIIESGTHEQLLERAGRYADLFRLQAAAYLGEALRPDPAGSEASTPI